MRKNLHIFGWLLILAFSTQSVYAVVTVKALRSWQAPDHIRLVFDLNKRVKKHSLTFLEEPHRLVLDIDNSRLASPNILKTELGDPVIAIRYGKQKKSTRLVVDLKSKVSARSFLLEPNEQYGYRLIVDMYKGIHDETSFAELPEQTLEKDRDIVVTIDAGHGGEDPGAISFSGRKEKDIVLAFSEELYEQLNQKTGIQAKLTRKDDYFIRLRKRTQLAQTHNADLFVSVHANSFPKSKKVSGFMVFALSDKGATSEMARWLAKSENKSDSIGGEEALPLEGKTRDLRKILIDLSMTSVLNHSIFAGNAILNEVSESFKLHSKKVELASFAVLKSASIPSVLVELGFLSNKNEDRQLASSAYRKKMVQKIAQGIVNYLELYPPYGTLLATKRNKNQHIYTVAENDTISDIAQKFSLSIEELKKKNNLKNNIILVGQNLAVGVDIGQQERSAKELKNYYIVKEGDTLSHIAIMFGTSVTRIQKLNNNLGILKAGQKIRIYP